MYWKFVIRCDEKRLPSPADVAALNPVSALSPNDLGSQVRIFWCPLTYSSGASSSTALEWMIWDLNPEMWLVSLLLSLPLLLDTLKNVKKKKIRTICFLNLSGRCCRLAWNTGEHGEKIPKPCREKECGVVSHKIAFPAGRGVEPRSKRSFQDLRDQHSHKDKGELNNYFDIFTLFKYLFYFVLLQRTILVCKCFFCCCCWCYK